MFLPGRLCPYTQTLDKAERLARDKHSSLLQKFGNYDRKKFYNTGPNVIKISTSEI